MFPILYIIQHVNKIAIFLAEILKTVVRKMRTSSWECLRGRHIIFKFDHGRSTLLCICLNTNLALAKILNYCGRRRAFSCRRRHAFFLHLRRGEAVELMEPLDAKLPLDRRVFEPMSGKSLPWNGE